MTIRKLLALPFLLAAFITFGSSLGLTAEVLKTGDTFPALKAKDQHEKDYEFKPGTSAVLIAFDMASGKKANKILADKGADYLDRKKAVYISNIHGMPAIGRFFALPKMRKYPHRIILADAEGLLDSFPQKEDRVTVMRLNEQAKITSVDFWNPEDGQVEDYLK